MEFLSRHQVICSRIPLIAKENKVYLVECNEDLDRDQKSQKATSIEFLGREGVYVVTHSSRTQSSGTSVWH